MVEVIERDDHDEMDDHDEVQIRMSMHELSHTEQLVQNSMKLLQRQIHLHDHIVVLEAIDTV